MQRAGFAIRAGSALEPQGLAMGGVIGAGGRNCWINPKKSRTWVVVETNCPNVPTWYGGTIALARRTDSTVADDDRDLAVPRRGVTLGAGLHRSASRAAHRYPRRKDQHENVNPQCRALASCDHGCRRVAIGIAAAAPAVAESGNSADTSPDLAGGWAWAFLRVERMRKVRVTTGSRHY